MDLESLYNEQYRLGASEQPSASLLSFLKSGPLNEWLMTKHHGKWCELGCGSKSLFESQSEFSRGPFKTDCVGLDFSKVAIEKATLQSKIEYKYCDISKGIVGGPYSLILDGHFLHCLSSLPSVYETLGHIRNALEPSGLFVAEVMMSHKHMSFDTAYTYDESSNVLYQGDTPIRVILSAREWEDLLLNSGMEIKFFVCQSSIKMIASNERVEPMNGDPECLRFVIQKIGD